MDKWAYLITGGILGTLARYILSGTVDHKAGMALPFGTLTVNLVGCFLVGFLDIWAERKFTLMPHMRLLLVTGFCGAFTTFSAFILESYTLVREGHMAQAFMNVMGSVALGLIVFRLGMLLGEKIWF